MTIASEITRINTNIANAYSACSTKGATMPATQNSANLATCIGSIPTGGGGVSNGQYLVRVIDYDGTILKEEHLNQNDTFTLPSNPSHTGLTFQGWSSPVTITSGSITVPNQDVTIGATYTTVSGLSEFDITLTTVTELTVTLNMDGTKNWGDGTTDTNTSHTYASAGDYTITCNGTTMTTSSSSGLFGQAGGLKNNYYVKAVRLANITTIASYAFQYCASLSSITIPEEVISFGNQVFAYCYSLLGITIPKNITSISDYTVSACYSLLNIAIPAGVTSIGKYVFYLNYSLTSITIPAGVTSIDQNSFHSCFSLSNIVLPALVTSIPNNFFYMNYSLNKITIPAGVTSVGSGAFNYCYSIIEYDFSNCSSIPTLSNTTAFGNNNKISKIKVPKSLESSWKESGNWVTYADYIIGV